MDTRRLRIGFTLDGQRLSVRVSGGTQETAYNGDARDAVHLPSLPKAITDDTPVEQIARQYQEFFRQLHGTTTSGLGPNAMEAIFQHIGTRAGGSADLRFVSGDTCLWLSGRPWELLLHDADRDQLRDRLRRVAVVRSTGSTRDYSPRRINGKLRVLLLQGADGSQPLDFAGERSALDGAWHGLGPTLQAHVDRPVIRPAFRSALASNVATVNPHLLWFSGHGRPVDNDFELLLGNGEREEWTRAAWFRDALLEAAGHTGNLPIVVAFWACEAGGSPGPSLDAGSETFPLLVKAIVETGVEAVIGVQTQVYDTSARVMGSEFFRTLAEGIGPAQSLGSARAQLLAIPKDRRAPGRGSEWTSPVMWVNGADLPAIEWRRPLHVDEALAFQRLGMESILVFEGGHDILQEQPDRASASATEAWVAQAPMWVTCRDLHLVDRRMEIIRRFRSLVLFETKTVLVIQFNALKHDTLLDAVAQAFLDLQGRLYPKPDNEGVDFLASLFEAFRLGGRQKAWRELLNREDMIIVIIADGGLPPTDDLRDARSSAASLLVFSETTAEAFDSGAARWDGWHADNIDLEDSSVITDDEALNAFIVAFAALDKPLSKDAIAVFARDFDVDSEHIPADRYFASLGDRSVVKASIARSALEALTPDQLRAAHRACMAILPRLKAEFDAPIAQQLVWRLDHALRAGEDREGLQLASKAIQILDHRGDYRSVIQVFVNLGALRRRLPLSVTMNIANAFNHLGNPKRAYDLLRQTPISAKSSDKDILRFNVLMAEALRNLPDAVYREQSITVLEAIVADYANKGSLSEDASQWLLIAQHDLGRNVHYFRQDGRGATAIFRRVIAQCSDRPELAYLKAAALRNLSDALDRYAYNRLEPDPAGAEQCIREAVEIASTYPLAARLLPEMLYLLAKYEYPEKRGQAGRHIKRAITLAREYGNGFILTLAKNKLFWWRVGLIVYDVPPHEFSFREWARLEKELDLLNGHPWPLRTLVDSRVRAAKCLSLLGQRTDAMRVLERARDVLLEYSIFDYKGDWTKRWQPVFAGLATLSTPAAQDSGSGRIDLWADLRAVASAVGYDHKIGAKDARQVWKEVV